MAHGDLESPEPDLIHPRREAVGGLAAPGLSEAGYNADWVTAEP